MNFSKISYWMKDEKKKRKKIKGLLKKKDSIIEE
jgi:hypothetical protein